MTCGEKIADLRKKRGMTQDDLGKEMNVSYQAVSKWERGESQPDFETMSKIAKLFSVPIGYFEENGELNIERQEEAEPAPAASNEEPAQPQEETIGVCTVCGRMLKESETDTTSPKIVCKACAKRQTEEAARQAERRRIALQQEAERKKQAERYEKEAAAREVLGHGFDATLIVSLVLAAVGYIVFAVLMFGSFDSIDSWIYGVMLMLVPLVLFGISHSVAGSIKEWKGSSDESGYNLVLSLIIGGIFAVINIALFLVAYLSVEEGEDAYFMGLMIVGAIASFTFVSQFLWGSVIQEVFTAGGFTFKLPGFIITLSFDSIIWMIVTKIFLAIAAAIIFVLTTAIVATVAILGSVFFFIPCVLWKIGRDKRARNSLRT